MLDRVTENHALHDPLMDDERTTRFAEWRAGLVAHSHVLIKIAGSTISASWSVSNIGGVSGTGFLSIAFPGLAGPILGGNVSIPAGGMATLTVSGPMPALAPGFTYDAQLVLNVEPPATVAPGGIHFFTITVPAPAAALLRANGIPTIT